MTDQKCLASEIVSALGGAENVTSASYCMTRLRVYLEDESIADDEKIKSIEGVKGLTKVNDHYQVIVGSEVKALYPIDPYGYGSIVSLIKPLTDTT